jgi:hypothetical protein
MSPGGEGDLGVSLARAFAQAGHSVSLVASAALTGGHGALIRARRAGAEAPATAALTLRARHRLCRRRPDLVLVVKGRFLRAADVRRLRQCTDGPLVNWAPDAPLYPEFREKPWIEALREYDLVCIWSEQHAEELGRQGIRAQCVPFGYDPMLSFPPAPGTPERFDVAFVGQWSPLREQYVKELAGLKLALSGREWASRLRGTPLARSVLPGRHFGLAVSAIYHASRIGLNILHPQNAGTHNMRTWELPATMTAMVATDSEFHRNLFGRDGPVLVEGPGDLRAAVEDLLADPPRRASIAQRGYAAVAAGTYRRRVEALLDMLPRVAG